MSKGRNAAKTFTATRAARFADSRERTAQQKAAEVAAGARRTTMLVDAADVRDDDVVCTRTRGFVARAEAEVDEFVVDGKAFVRRFVTGV